MSVIRVICALTTIQQQPRSKATVEGDWTNNLSVTGGYPLTDTHQF